MRLHFLHLCLSRSNGSCRVTPKAATNAILSTMAPGETFSLPWLKWTAYTLCGEMVGLMNYYRYVVEYRNETMRRVFCVDTRREIWRVL